MASSDSARISRWTSSMLLEALTVCARRGTQGVNVLSGRARPEGTALAPHPQPCRGPKLPRGTLVPAADVLRAATPSTLRLDHPEPQAGPHPLLPTCIPAAETPPPSEQHGTLGHQGASPQGTALCLRGPCTGHSLSAAAGQQALEEPQEQRPSATATPSAGLRGGGSHVSLCVVPHSPATGRSQGHCRRWAGEAQDEP